MINFINLQYFLVLTEEMNFGRAAQKLFITQQSLSGHIQKLEEYFNVPLFNRTPTLTLTPAGIHLKQRATELLSIEGNLKKELLDIDSYIGGDLVVGSTHVRTSVLLPAILRSFHEEYPDVSIKLFEGNTPQIEDALHKGKIDVSIGFEPEDSRMITSIPLYQERFVIVIPDLVVGRYYPQGIFPHSGETQNDFIFKCLMRCPFISLAKGTKIAAYNQEFFSTFGIKPNVFLETKNVGTMLSFCAESLGIITCPETFIRFSHYDFPCHHIYMLPDIGTQNRIVINCRDSMYRSQTVEMFIGTTKKLLANLLER